MRELRVITHAGEVERVVTFTNNQDRVSAKFDLQILRIK